MFYIKIGHNQRSVTKRNNKGFIFDCFKKRKGGCFFTDKYELEMQGR